MTLQNLDPKIRKKIVIMGFSPNFFFGKPNDMWRGSFQLPTNLRRVAKFRRNRFRDGRESLFAKNYAKHNGCSLLH